MSNGKKKNEWQANLLLSFEQKTMGLDVEKWQERPNCLQLSANEPIYM